MSRVENSLNDEIDQERRNVKKFELDALDMIQRPDRVSLPKDNLVLHMKSDLVRKRVAQRTISNHKARLVVCENEKVKFHKECFLLVWKLSTVRLEIRLGLQGD